MFAEFLVLKKSARTFKGLFERISPVLCKQCFARTPRSYRSIAPPKERRRHVWTCPFHWRTVFVITHAPSPIVRTDRINLEPWTGGRAQLELWIGLGWMLCFPWYQWGFLESEQWSRCRKWKLYGYTVIRPVWSLERNQHVMVQLSQLIFWKSIFSHWPC